CGVGLGLRRAGNHTIRWGLTQHGFGSYAQATHEDGLIQGPRTQTWMRRIERWITARAGWVMAPTALSLAQLARDLDLPSRPAHWHHVPHARPALTPAPPQVKAAARAALGW